MGFPPTDLASLTDLEINVLSPEFDCPTDGISDCLPAFTLAKAAAGIGGSVVVPAGIYMLAAALTLDVANQDWRFRRGATVMLMAATAADVIDVTASGVWLEGPGVIDGNQANQIVGGRGVALLANDAQVHDLTVQNTVSYGIHGQDGQRHIIAGCTVNGTISAGIFEEFTSAYTGATAEGPSITRNRVDRSATLGASKAITVHGTVFSIADAAVTAGSATVTSATNAFLNQVVGRYIIGTGVDDDTTMAAVAVDGSSITMSKVGISTSVAIATRTQAGFSATVGTATPHRFVVGDTVTVAGTGDANFNGTWVITAATATSFTFTSSGTAVLAKTVTSGTVIFVSGSIRVLTAVLGVNISNNRTLMPATGNPSISIEAFGGCYGATVVGNRTWGGSMGISIDRSPHTAVVGNTCRTPTTIGIELAGSRDCGVVGNTVNGLGITTVGVSCSGTRQPFSDRALIANNVVKNLAASSASRCAYKVSDAFDVTLSGNTASELNGNPAVRILGTLGVTMSGGVCDGSSVSTYMVSADSSQRFSVAGVRAKNFVSGGIVAFTAATEPQLVLNNTAVAIQLDGTPADLVISTNAATTGTTSWNGQVTVAPVWQAEDNNLLEQTFDPVVATANNSAGATSGLSRTIAMKARQSRSVTNIVMYLGVSGTSLVNGQCFAAIYQNGALIGITADQSAAWAAAPGVVTMAIAGGPVTITAGKFYIVFWFNGSGTSPSFRGGSAIAAVNTGAAGGAPRFGSADAGLTNAASAPNPLGAISAVATSYWAAIS